MAITQKMIDDHAMGKNKHDPIVNAERDSGINRLDPSVPGMKTSLRPKLRPTKMGVVMKGRGGSFKGVN